MNMLLILGSDLVDLFQRAACLLITVREGLRAGFSGSVSGVWPLRVCYPTPLATAFGHI